MRFLLINTNPAVSKLVHASLERIGYEAAEIDNYGKLGLDSYIGVIIDSDSYKPEYKDDLLSVSIAPSLIYLSAQNTNAPQDISFTLRKPFLPIDFITFITSILYKTPELKRFITHEAEEFKDSAINVKLEQTRENVSAPSFVQPEISATEQKPPVFSVQESALNVSDNKISFEEDMFADFSSDLQKFYSGESIDENISPPPATKTTPPINEPISFTQEALNKPFISAETEPQTENLADIFSGSFMFKARSEEENETISPPPQEPKEKIEELIASSLNETESQKIDFVFDTASNINSAEEEKENVVDFSFKEPLFKDIEPQKSAEPTNQEPNGVSFGDLAKEFPDLLGTSEQQPSAHANASANFFKNETNQNASSIQVEPDKFQNEIENLSETDMTKALQDGGMLPQPSEIEVAKAEIGNIVEQSVKGMLQSQILREVFKGLKMNITITFEDK